MSEEETREYLIEILMRIEMGDLYLDAFIIDGNRLMIQKPKDLRQN